ncbi:MAG: ferredoxin reductase [Chloroflexi bacterium]|nr:ferredoxin reductase [Chloroflexota bacterium]
MSQTVTQTWQIATVTSVHDESSRVKLFTLELAHITPFRAGQHFDLRLTAPDGYQAQRSYSVTSSPDEPNSIELAIELISEGEVSSYFHEAVEPGDKIEIRGPIGGHFTWSPVAAKPVVMICGGSGIAPIMSMLRHRNSTGSDVPALLLFSTRTVADILFRDELETMAHHDPKFHLVNALTRIPTIGSVFAKKFEQGQIGRREMRRIDRSMIDAAFAELGVKPARAYICGGSDFVESMANHLLNAGMANNSIRTERFGP